MWSSSGLDMWPHLLAHCRSQASFSFLSCELSTQQLHQCQRGGGGSAKKMDVKISFSIVVVITALQASLLFLAKVSYKFYLFLWEAIFLRTQGASRDNYHTDFGVCLPLIFVYDYINFLFILYQFCYDVFFKICLFHLVV